MQGKSKLVFLFVVLALITAVALTGCRFNQSGDEAGGENPQVLQGKSGTLAQARATTGYSDVAEAAVESVVNVSSVKTVRTRQTQSPFFNDPFFRHFFGDPRGVPRERRQQSLGSGVIVSTDGIILTNNHVVADATEVRVILHDQTELNAKIVGTDPKSDLAVIKVEHDGLQPISLGDSDALRLGEVVLAIGSPFGLSHTVTMGIVSAKGRSRVGIVDYEDFIQTDAAINPGNSGGALINASGELIGINTAIASRTGGYQGIGFAIPINMAKQVMDSLVQFGRVERGYLGVMIQDVPADMTETFGLSSPTGALIADVLADGPAGEAGFQRGDVVLEFNGKVIDDAAMLRNMVSQVVPGNEVAAIVWRDKKRVTLTVKVARQPGESEIARGKDVDPENAVVKDVGLEVANLDAMIRARFKIADEIDGVVVTQVFYGGPAAQAGFEIGDVILEVNRKATTDVAQFKRMIEKSGSKAMLLVSREGRTMYVVLRLR